MNIKKISFVIPAKDEGETIVLLYQRINDVVKGIGVDYEFIFIDDGSTDNTWNDMQELAKLWPSRVRAIQMRTNVGKARALAVGFEKAQGDVVFTLDADLQDDPLEIPRFLDKLQEGYDVVSGYKKVRHDPWHKVLPSRVFNLMVSKLSGVKLHDHNCGFKCYRSEVIKKVKLYGELHRMVPCLASIEGFRSTEIVVKHHPRAFGQSKYGVKRFTRGFFDMVSVCFIKNYRERPMHLFGGVGVVLLAVCGALLAAGAVTCFFCTQSALLVTACAFVTGVGGVVLLAIGLFCELLISGRLASEDRAPISEDSKELQVFRTSFPKAVREVGLRRVFRENIA